jgi:hypothetical protein
MVARIAAAELRKHFVGLQTVAAVVAVPEDSMAQSGKLVVRSEIQFAVEPGTSVALAAFADYMRHTST